MTSIETLSSENGDATLLRTDLAAQTSLFQDEHELAHAHLAKRT